MLFRSDGCQVVPHHGNTEAAVELGHVVVEGEGVIVDDDLVDLPHHAVVHLRDWRGGAPNNQSDCVYCSQTVFLTVRLCLLQSDCVYDSQTVFTAVRLCL